MTFLSFVIQRLQKYFYYIPLTFICISFLTGIAAGNLIDLDSKILIKYYLGIFLFCFLLKRRSLRFFALYAFMFVIGVFMMHKQSDMRPDNLVNLLGEGLINGYVKDVDYKNERTNIILYNVDWENADYEYNGMIRLAYKGKINVIQDQEIRANVNIEMPENWDAEFDYIEYLGRKKIYLIGDGRSLEIVGNKKSLIYYLSSLKKEIVYRIKKIYGEPEASLLLGLVAGYRADFDEIFNEALSKTGTTHIIAISGFNISLLIGMVVELVGHIGRRPCFLLALLVSILFCVLTGACPSIVRATIMAIVVLIGKELGRESYPSILLLLTASIMTLFNPYILWDISFQLSFLSTIGLTYLSPVFNLFIKKNAYLESIFLTSAAFITTLPTLVSTFGQFSILVFISNFLILPIVSIGTILGLINTLLALINLELGMIFSFINFLPLRYIVFVIETLARLPLNLIEVNFEVNSFHIFTYYLILFIFILYKDFKIHFATKS